MTPLTPPETSRAAKSLERLALALSGLLDQLPDDETLHRAIEAADDLGELLVARPKAVAR